MTFRINERGAAIGRSDNPFGSSRASSWDRSGRMTDLGVLPGDDWSAARSINEAVIWRTGEPSSR